MLHWENITVIDIREFCYTFPDSLANMFGDYSVLGIDDIFFAIKGNKSGALDGDISIDRYIVSRYN